MATIDDTHINRVQKDPVLNQGGTAIPKNIFSKVQNEKPFSNLMPKFITDAGINLRMAERKQARAERRQERRKRKLDRLSERAGIPTLTLDDLTVGNQSVSPNVSIGEPTLSAPMGESTSNISIGKPIPADTLDLKGLDLKNIQLGEQQGVKPKASGAEPIPSTVLASQGDTGATGTAQGATQPIPTDALRAMLLENVKNRLQGDQTQPIPVDFDQLTPEEKLLAVRRQKNKLLSALEQDIAERNLTDSSRNITQQFATGLQGAIRDKFQSRIAPLQLEESVIQQEIANIQSAKQAEQQQKQQEFENKLALRKLALDEAKLMMEQKRLMSSGLGTEQTLALIEQTPEFQEMPSFYRNKLKLETALDDDRIGQANRTTIGDALSIVQIIDRLVKDNPEGDFKTVGRFFRRGKNKQEVLRNRQAFATLDLLLQQWASGASLTGQQTRQVMKMRPKNLSSDKAIRENLEGLVDIMLADINGRLLSEGIDMEFERTKIFDDITGQALFANDTGLGAGGEDSDIQDEQLLMEYLGS